MEMNRDGVEEASDAEVWAKLIAVNVVEPASVSGRIPMPSVPAVPGSGAGGTARGLARRGALLTNRHASTSIMRL